MLGIVGAGNMAGALARGWGDPVLATDGGSGRAQALVDELGGEALGSDNAELFRRCDTILLGHKPYQLRAGRRAGRRRAARPSISVLGGDHRRRAAGRLPGRRRSSAPCPTRRWRSRQGVTCIAAGRRVRPVARFERVGRVVRRCPRRRSTSPRRRWASRPPTSRWSPRPRIDAAVRSGLRADLATEIFLAALAGSAQLLQARGGDTLAVRREVTSPGGSTARGLAALERHGLRTAFDEATRAVLEPMSAAAGRDHPPRRRRLRRGAVQRLHAADLRLHHPVDDLRVRPRALLALADGDLRVPARHLRAAAGADPPASCRRSGRSTSARSSR